MKLTKSQIGLILTVATLVAQNFGIVPQVAPGKACPELVAE